MLAMQLRQPGAAEDNRLMFAETAQPEPGPGEILLRVKACGVCHTDLHIVEGEIKPAFLPITPGHQVVATITALGGGVSGLEIGQRVGVPWLFSTCGKCEFCRRGEENLCPQACFTGFDVNGGFAEWMVADSRFVLPIPAALSDLQAAPLLCAGIIGYRSLHRAGLSPGEKLGLIGFGASAHLAIQVANYWSCEVYVFTRSESHRQHALQLGAKWAGGIEDPVPDLLDRAVLFAPSGALVPLILAKLRPGGTLAINAIYLTPIPEMNYELIYGERTLCSVANATYQDGVDFIELAGQISLQVDVTSYPMQEANQALIDLKHSRFNGEAVLVVD